MVSHTAPSLWLTNDDGVIVSEWTISLANFHFYDYGFNE
jgi:hypothetical protein